MEGGQLSGNGGEPSKSHSLDTFGSHIATERKRPPNWWPKSRSEGITTAPLCDRGAHNNPTAGSHSRSLIDLKMHRLARWDGRTGPLPGHPHPCFLTLPPYLLKAFSHSSYRLALCGLPDRYNGARYCGNVAAQKHRRRYQLAIEIPRFAFGKADYARNRPRLTLPVS